MEQFWLVTSYLSLLFAALVTTGLVIVYGFATQWDKTQVGRQFMLTKACLAAVLDYWAILVIFIMKPAAYTSTMPIRSIICSIIGVIMLRWVIILVRAQRDARRKDEDLRS